MKKKIGFIDLHIDEWHANNYPAWIRGADVNQDFELGYAWEESPNPDGKDLAAWCAAFGMTPAASIEEVIEKSDAICVLAPSNPEAHARLADLALRSGKPLYIDKTFAPDRATAEGFFALAKEHNTPLMSSSALRYGAELTAAMSSQFAEKRPEKIDTFGGGSSFQEYGIHQLEMVVTALGTGAKSVTCIRENVFQVSYDDNRSAVMNYSKFYGGFISILTGKDNGAFVLGADRMFETLIGKILEFYKTGISPIPAAETIEIAAIREAALKAMEELGKAIPVWQ